MTEWENAETLLRCALGNPAATFRKGQWEAIDHLVNHNRKILVVQRTGWGKSSVFFIATRILRDRGKGPTLIVSPLLALMRNQIRAAQALSIRALTINSTNRDEWPALIAAIQNNETDAILVSPERLANDEFVQQVLLPAAGHIGLLVVDEVHCISDWGHDFRPDYRRLASILSFMPVNMPLLGTTATANNRVLDDIKEQLGDLVIQRGTLMRESLALQTMRLSDQSARLAWLAEHIPQLPGTGIIYTLTRRDAEQVAEWLQQNGIEARAYHSSIVSEEYPSSHEYRLHLEELLLNNHIKVLVATTALGMGYDKPDLGFVIHYQAPGSVVAYYQQVGRAGRSIEHAFGIMMTGSEDEEIHEYFRNAAFPNVAHVTAILDALATSDGLAIREIEPRVNLHYGQIEKALSYLSVENPAPVLKDGNRWVRTPVSFALDQTKIQRLTGQREKEWRQVQQYIDTRECLMTYLARALDDAESRPCGKCGNCLGRPVVSHSFCSETAARAILYLKQADIPLICKRSAGKNAFPLYGFSGNFPVTLRAETGRILSRWGDAGWGRVVAEDKRSGRFREELVEATADMIQLRWKPLPAPVWITCVPSRLHPGLVPDFCQRLASRLGLPFLPVIVKIRDNGPQKMQQNRFYQCRNLDGVFAVEEAVPEHPVLLVDDMVDSTWTMAVTAALLLQAGSGPVWPLALAKTTSGD